MQLDQVTQFIEKMDNAAGYIQKRLVDLNLDKRVNVIHLSDHGMNTVTPPHFINLTAMVDPNQAKIYGSSPVVQIVPYNLGLYKHIFTAIRFRIEIFTFIWFS